MIKYDLYSLAIMFINSYDVIILIVETLVRKYRLLIAPLLLVALFITLPQGTAENTYIESYGTIVDHSPNAHTLYADGTKLISPTGEVVVLSGTQFDYNALARHGDNWFGVDDVQTMKSYGGKILELNTIYWSDMMPQKGVVDENWFVTKLDKWVSWCEQYELYHIISLRNFVYQPWGAGQVPSWFLEGKYNPPYNKTVVDQACIDFWDIDNPLHNDNREYFIQMFQFIADRYKDNKYVLFGLVNEPFCGNKLMNSELSKHLGFTYARFIERIVDAIRSTGAKQLIFVDRPYVWHLSNVQPVDRPNIVWEDHLYVSPDFDIGQWKNVLDDKVQRFINDFEKPLYIGEYAPYPYSAYDGELSDWRTILAEQVAFLKSVPVCGYSWHEYPFLEGEWYDSVYNYLNAEESEYILRTIYG